MIVRFTPLALVLAFVSGAGAGAASFTDPVGDSGAAADVAAVSVRNTARNDVVLEVRLANRPEWTGGVLRVFLDADRNEATGSDGADYYLALNAGAQWEFARWNDGDYELLPGEGIKAEFGGGEVAFTFNSTHIGGTRAFDFWVATEDGPDFDDAPPEPKKWTFELTPPRVTGGTPTYAPAKPRAGARFAVTRVSLVIDGVAREQARRFTCHATLGGKRLPQLRNCVWKLPRNARRKVLSVDVTVKTGPGSRLFLVKRFRVR